MKLGKRTVSRDRRTRTGKQTQRRSLEGMPLNADLATTCPINRSRRGRTLTASPCVKEEEKGATQEKGNLEARTITGLNETSTTSDKALARTKASNRTLIKMGQQMGTQRATR